MLLRRHHVRPEPDPEPEPDPVQTESAPQAKPAGRSAAKATPKGE